MAQEFKPTLGMLSAAIRTLRSDVANQFPELARNIYIVDTTRDPAGEIANAARHFGVSDLAERLQAAKPGSNTGVYPNFTGVCKPVILPGDPPRTVQIAYGWGYGNEFQNMPPTAPLDTNEYLNHLSVTLHETAHALQLSDRSANASKKSGNSGEVFTESFAEVFASAVMERHGLAPAGVVDSQMAGYDQRKYGARNDPYDPSEEFTRLRATYGDIPPYAPHDFRHFAQLREVYDRALTAMQSTQYTEREGDTIFEISRAAEVADYHLKKNGLDEAGREAWRLAHPEFELDGQQAAAATRYLEQVATIDAEYARRHVPVAERTYPLYTSVEPKVPDFAHVAAEAWLKQAAQPYDPVYQVAAQALIYGLQDAGYDSSGKRPEIDQSMLKVLATHPEITGWAQAIHNGATLEQVLPMMRAYAKEASHMPDATHVTPLLTTGTAPMGRSTTLPPR